ncbi:hypothetical protein [Cytobacillus sp. Bac17]|uniref:hypothetical protein n=1 Tax=Cytobacillus sp. Bac17 TaxID=2926008 RepID=UPI002118906C|nr:hypothetical protein [Cytobacillus sp. Bac17]
MNYLTLLLAITFMVGCTNTEDVSVTEEKTVSQVTTANTTENSNQEETEFEETTTIIDEPVEKEAPAQQNNERFPGYKLIEVDGGDLSGYRQPSCFQFLQFI